MPFFAARFPTALVGETQCFETALIRAQDAATARAIANAAASTVAKQVLDVPSKDSPSVMILEVGESTFQKMQHILPSITEERCEETGAFKTTTHEAVGIVERAIPPSATCAKRYRFGPRIFARVQPQPRPDDSAVWGDGAFEQDVTARVLALDLTQLQSLRDARDCTDALVTFEADAPFYVRIFDALCRFFQVTHLSHVTQEQLEAARIRASINPAELRAKNAFKLGDQPYTVDELRDANWKVDCIVPVPVDATYSDTVLERAISEIVTGSVHALQEIRYQRSHLDYGPEHVALRVTGTVSNPHAYFELDAATATPRSREIRLFLNTLTSSDVFEMSTGRTNRRYHIVSVDQAKLRHLFRPGVTADDLDNLGLAGECAVEYVVAEDHINLAGEIGAEAENFFALTELWSAQYCEDNTWTLKLDSGRVSLCFF